MQPNCILYFYPFKSRGPCAGNTDWWRCSRIFVSLHLPKRFLETQALFPEVWEQPLQLLELEIEIYLIWFPQVPPMWSFYLWIFHGIPLPITSKQIWEGPFCCCLNTKLMKQYFCRFWRLWPSAALPLLALTSSNFSAIGGDAVRIAMHCQTQQYNNKTFLSRLHSTI